METARKLKWYRTMTDLENFIKVLAAFTNKEYRITEYKEEIEVEVFNMDFEKVRFVFYKNGKAKNFY